MTLTAAKIPTLLKFETIPWVVFVTRDAVDDGFDMNHAMDRIESSDLWEQVEAGQMTEDEYYDKIGPERGYRPVDVYGPYSKRQAEVLAEYLQQPDMAAKHGITTAVASRLTRFIA